NPATEFLGSAGGGNVASKKLIVAGGAKRGWTTWTAGARVPPGNAIVPSLIGVVNHRPSMMTRYAAYIFLSAAIRNYAVLHDVTNTVERATKPKDVNLWQATNPKARHFRVMTIGKAYPSTPLQSAGQGVYVGRVGKPESGWTAFLVELVFDSGDEKAPYKFST